MIAVMLFIAIILIPAALKSRKRRKRTVCRVRITEQHTATPTKPDTSAQAEALAETLAAYHEVCKSIDRETRALKAEYAEAGERRRAAIAAKLTSLARQKASTLNTMRTLDEKQQKLWNS